MSELVLAILGRINYDLEKEYENGETDYPELEEYLKELLYEKITFI